MKARGGGVSRVYEDFKPVAEWQDDAQSHNLILHLPGFTKEQIRMSKEGENTIRLRGEREVGDNKWSRFVEDFEVPKNSDINYVRAKFHDGGITITIPKKLDESAKPTTDDGGSTGARPEEEEKGKDEDEDEAAKEISQTNVKRPLVVNMRVVMVILVTLVALVTYKFVS